MHVSMRAFVALGGHVRLVAPRVTRGSGRGAKAQGWAQVGCSGCESAGCCHRSLRCTWGSLTREPSAWCRAAQDRGGPGQHRGRLVCLLSCGCGGEVRVDDSGWDVRQGPKDTLQGLSTGPGASTSSCCKPAPQPSWLKAPTSSHRVGLGTTPPWPLVGGLGSSPRPLLGIPHHRASRVRGGCRNP